MSDDDKVPPRPLHEAEPSTPSLDELDSAWDSNEDDDLDEDATTVQKIPKELVALSRRGTEIEQPAQKTEEPEKHEAITARPPPMGEPTVVVDAPHERLAKAQEHASSVEEEEHADEETAAEDEADEVVAEAEEKRALAADLAAGLDAVALEERMAARKERTRAKSIAAKEKRKAHAEAQRQKQKKPKKRSIPPSRDAASAKREASASRQRVTGRPAPMVAEAPPVGARRDMIRMVFWVALVVILGALVIGLARR